MNPEEMLANADFVQSLARSLVRDDHLAADISQATWLAFLKHHPDTNRPLRSWLSRVIKNFAVSLHRTERRRGRRELAAARSEGVPSTREIVEMMETRRLLIEAVLALEEPYRSFIVLRFYEGIGVGEIARRLDMPVETVRTREKRGLDKLRKLLDGLHGGDRKQWFHAMAPLAGLKLAAPSAKTAVTLQPILTGVIAMTAKMKVLFLFTALLLIMGTVFIMWPFEGDERSEDILVSALDASKYEQPASEEAIVPSEDLREPLQPRGDAGVLPASWKAAMGGFKGRVVLADGTPVPDEKVEVYGFKILDLLQGANVLMEEEPAELALALEATRTAGDGTFLLSGIDGHGYYLLRIAAGARPMISRFIDAQPSPGETIDLGDIVLQKGTVLVGRVMDEKGDPLPGVRVRATQLPPMVFEEGLQDLREGCSLMFEFGIFGTRWFVIDLPPAVFHLMSLLAIPTTFTRSDGSFRLEGILEGDATAIMDKAGFLTHWQGPERLTQGQLRDLGTVTLQQGAAGKGIVLDVRNRPVAGIEVRVGMRYGKSNLCILQPTVKTNEKGAFAIRGAPNTTLYCALRRAASEPWIVGGPFHPRTQDLAIRLPPAFDLRVELFEKAGVPAKQAHLMIRTKDFFNFLPSRRNRSLGDRVETVREGVFKVKDLPPGEYDLLAKAPGCGALVKKVEITDSSLIESLILKPAGSITVKVLGGKDKSPVEWAEVFVKTRDGQWLEDPLECSRGRTDASGTVVFSDLAKGEYTAYAYHPAYAAGAMELEIPKDSEILLELDRGGTLEGTVHFKESLHDPPFAVFMEWRGHDGLPISTNRYTQTDSKGRFRMENLQPGGWRLYVMESLFDKSLPGLLKVTQGGPLAEGEVVMERGKKAHVDVVLNASHFKAVGEVSGRVLLDGLAVKGVWANLRGEDTEFAIASDSTGRYAFSKVPAGTYLLNMKIPSGGEGELGFELTREIIVSETQLLIEDFMIRTGTLFGRVESASGGHPVRGIRVKLSTVLEQEDVTISAFPPEKYENVQEALRVVNEDLREVNYANQRNKLIKMETLTGLDGTFCFRRVPEGLYDIKSTHSDQDAEFNFEWFFNPKAYPTSQTLTVEVTPGGSTGPAVLTIRTPVKVRGKVRFPEHTNVLPEIFLIVDSKDDEASERHLRFKLRSSTFELGKKEPVDQGES
ncbi:MAG: sigma-70 family RNA polymerase sigma factor [Planctomycetota bacterium]|jgi:RNA polymerase sigma-70 factor (ECF subfamily)